MKTKFISIFNSFKDFLVTEPMISLDNSHELPALFKRYGWRFIYICFPKKEKLTHRLKLLFIFTTYILSLRKRHGSEYVVKYLKNSTLAIQKCINGTPISSLKSIDNLPFPRLAHGLPRFIPLLDRKAIRRGNTNVIRFWISLYSLYRIVSIPGKLKLATITDSLSVSKDNVENGSKILSNLVSQFKDRFNLSILKNESWILPIEKASPNVKSSWTEMFSVPNLMKQKYPEIYKNMILYMEGMGQTDLSSYFKLLSENVNSEIVDKNLGRLAIKKEPAGKVRVFAMVDVWTQSVLKPLHDFLFDFLKRLPNDGTFDQQASVKRCAVKAKQFGSSWGYDLSAATDRLPVTLQVGILSVLIGETNAELWRSILVDRLYHFPKNEYNEEPKDLRYEVGQPMGALSSWAMLAVTHHLIVQLAYRRARPLSSKKGHWYENYELLGDDIVIFEEDVANEYLILMEEYGLAINLTKSVISNNGGFEFAKNTYFKGVNVSAIPFRMLISNNTRLGRVSNALHFIRTLDIKHPIAYCKKVLKTRKETDLDFNFNLVALLTMFLSKKAITYTDLIRSLISCSPRPAHTTLERYLPTLDQTYLSNLFVSLLRGKDFMFRNEEMTNQIFALDSYFHRESMIERILNFREGISFDTLQENLTTEICRYILREDFPDSFDINNHLVRLQPVDKQIFTFTFKTVSLWYKGILDVYFLAKPKYLDRMNLDELVKLTQKIETITTLNDLVKRSKLKEAGDTSSNRIVQEYNLKALQFVIKANKKRPLFTYSPLQVQDEFERIQFWWKF